MKLENFSSKTEQEKTREELLSIMDSVTKKIKNSDDAYELASKINEFKKIFEKDGLKLKDYLLGGVLLSPDDASNIDNYANEDTDGKKIEHFIRSLSAEFQ